MEIEFLGCSYRSRYLLSHIYKHSTLRLCSQANVLQLRSSSRFLNTLSDVASPIQSLILYLNVCFQHFYVEFIYGCSGTVEPPSFEDINHKKSKPSFLFISTVSKIVSLSRRTRMICRWNPRLQGIQYALYPSP